MDVIQVVAKHLSIYSSLSLSLSLCLAMMYEWLVHVIIWFIEVYFRCAFVCVVMRLRSYIFQVMWFMLCLLK